MLKLLKKESLYSNIRITYIITVIFYSLARQNVTALQPYLMSDLLNIAVIGVAGLLVLWDVVVFRNIWKTKYIWLLAAFGGLTVVSSVLGFRYGYIENVKSIANLFIQFCLLYVVGVRKERNEIEREVRIISDCVGFGWFIAAFVSVLMYFADFSYTANRYLWGETTEIVQGFVHEHYGVTVMRLWGVFVDPNFASAVCIAVICMSAFVLLTSQKKAQKIFHIVNIIVQYIYIVLSNSRMGLLILCLVVFIGGWYYSFLIIGKKKVNVIVKELISVVLAVVCTGLCYASVQLTKTTLPYVRYAIDMISYDEDDNKSDVSSENTTDADENMTYEDESTTEANDTTVENQTEEPSSAVAEKPQIENLDRQDVVVKSDISNGRFSLWMEGIKTVFKDNMIMGVGPRNYHTVAKLTDPTTRISTGYSIHNSFVELLMGNGVVGTLVILLFFVLCAKDTVVVRYKNPDKAKRVGVLMLLVLSILACGMFIACLLYTLSGVTVIMFTFLGYAVSLMKKDKDSESK